MRKEGLSTGLSHPGLERKAVGASCLGDRGQEDSHYLERCVRPSLPRNIDVHTTGSEAQPHPTPGGAGGRCIAPQYEEYGQKTQDTAYIARGTVTVSRTMETPRCPRPAS